MLKLLALLAAVSTGLGIGVRKLEPRFAFAPSRGESSTPADLRLRFDADTVDTADGEQLRGWVVHAERPRAYVVYFHGNGGNLSVWLPILAGIVRQGYTVAAIDYRGYGASTGSPTERGLYRDVDAALQWVSPRAAAAGVPLVYWGRSLGTTMAAYAAGRHPPEALILESGFPNARRLLRLSPVLTVLAALSTYRFPTEEFMQRVTCPVLVMHGDNDRVVPFSAGQDLYENIPGPKIWMTLAGTDHNDLEPHDPVSYWTGVNGFLATHIARRANARTSN
jgi:uncharacterized protein